MSRTWQLANEPQASDELGYIGEIALKPNPNDLLFPWVDRISRYIRSLAPQQLISLGFESKQGEYYFKAAQSFSTIDYATAHCWVQNWGIYDMYNASGANLHAAQAFATGFVRNTSRWAADIGKPVFLEEFGMARDNWENKDKEYPYLSSAGTSHKDAYFKVRFFCFALHICVSLSLPLPRCPHSLPFFPLPTSPHPLVAHT
jgi:mannan endo-1,4-beta-mannosidase